MSSGSKILPIKCNLDIAAQFADQITARFIKNLTHNVGATDAYDGIKEGQNEVIQKSLQSNELYIPNIELPDGDNICIGAKGFAQVNRVYCFCWNSLGNHFIFRVNGNDRTYQIVKVSPLFNFKLNPKYFVHKQGIWLEVLQLVKQDGTIKIIEDLYWTEGFNYMGYIRVNDCIDSNGFTTPYFDGNYDKAILFRMGIPTPNSCISIFEIARTPEDAGLINNLLFKTWQFRIKVTDIFGRPTEHSIISDLYIPGINDCIGSNQSLPRCLDLEFDAGNPLWDTIDIEYRNCNDEQWYKTTTLFLYTGSPIGDWWLRERNPDIIFDPVAHTITYEFCADGERNAVPTIEINRLDNPLPKRCQTLIKIAERIGTGNNTDGFNPFSTKDVLDNISIKVIPPNTPAPQARAATIYIPIYSWDILLEGGGGAIQDGNVFSGVNKDGTNGYTWGAPLPDSNLRAYLQYFPAITQSGFVGYLLGGKSIAISTQVYIDSNGNEIDDPNHIGFQQGFLCFQKFVFNDLRPGTYTFRLASHLSDPTTLGQQELPTYGEFQDIFHTSTTVWGLCPFNKNGHQIRVHERNSYQELTFDVCDVDYNTFNDNNILVIVDVSKNFIGAITDSSGYIYETRSVANGQNTNPVELMTVGISSSDAVSTINTDHNGFWWASLQNNIAFILFGFYNKCLKRSFFYQNSKANLMSAQDFYLDEVGSFAWNGSPAYPDFSTTPCNHIIVEGRIVLTSNNDIGVPNVLVYLTRSQFAYTDDEGYYQILVHDLSSGNSIINDSVIFSGSVCNYKNIDGGCIPIEGIQILPCNNADCTIRVVDVAEIDVIYNPTKGLLSGGVYGIGCVGSDWLGRTTFIQPLGNISIPTILQSKTIAPSQIQVTINPDATFPLETSYITFWYTKELTYEDYIDWIVDSIQLVDNTGEINNTSPTQIRIYYQSLNEFNKQNNFNTTTNWQFLEPLPTGQTTQQPFTSDIVQFLFNGNGTFFFNTADAAIDNVRAITALIKYDQTGTYFLIDYTSYLSNLQAGALIRLARPRTSVNEEEPYFEICDVVNIVNQKAQTNQFILNAFDTYYLDTQIPVPVQTNPIPTVSQVATVSGNITTYTVPVPTAQAISLKTFPFPFERNSPSNFWGQGCKNIGRVNVKNPYESEIIHFNQIALGGALSSNGKLSYLQYFSDDKYDVPIQNTSGITSLFFRQGMVFGLTQYGKFRVGYNDNNIRINADGQVVVPSKATQFGNPEVDLQNDYGCQLIDKSSIIEINANISFVDRNKGEALHYDFNTITSYTKDERLNDYGVKNGKCDSWFRTKIRSMQNNPNRYFVGGYDPIGNEYILTDFSLDIKNYINNERAYIAQSNETVVFDITTTDLRGWRSFVPEMMAYLDQDILNNNLFTFKGGKPYSHYNLNKNNSYNEFFGVQCSKIITIIQNQPLMKKKGYLNLSIYCKETNWFSDLITTQSGQKSYMMLNDFEQAMFFTFGAFLKDLNTPTDPSNLTNVENNYKITEGLSLYGDYLEMRLIGNIENDNKYCELLGIEIFTFLYEKT